MTETTFRWHDSYLSQSSPHTVEWERVDMASLDGGERERIIYRVAAEVARNLPDVSGWRVQRCGLGIGIWTGPGRQRCRAADYQVWVEDAGQPHLHRISASAALRKFADDLDAVGMTEAAELAREASRNPDANL